MRVSAAASRFDRRGGVFMNVGRQAAPVNRGEVPRLIAIHFPRMLRRLRNLIRGFFSLFVSGIERRNPEALLEVEKENLRKQIANYNQGLAAHAGLCERLMAQIRKLEADERDLRAKASANLRAGNRELASEHALRLDTVRRELGENRTQLEQAETTYRELLKARDVSVPAAMAGGMISRIGGAGDTLSRLHEMVEEEREKAAGRARVARGSLAGTEIAIKEDEHRALADQALADFEAREGIYVEARPVERKLIEPQHN